MTLAAMYNIEQNFIANFITTFLKLTMKKSRIPYIDTFKSIGIILMIFDHVGFGKALSHIIHSFHVPMFFFISGFLNKDEKIKKTNFSIFLIKKARTLLLPYLFFSLFY